MVKRYFILLFTFLAVDLLWLLVIAPKLYQGQIGHLMAASVKWPAALIFYLIYALALLVFVVNPAMEKAGLVYALVYGGFLGLAMYATYDLTNLATLKDWPMKITWIDLAWGTLVTGLTCTISVKLIRRFHLN